MTEHAAEADLEEQATDVVEETVDDEAPLDAEETVTSTPDDVDEADYAEQKHDAGSPEDDYDYWA
ncbi:hypothetical protein SAMN05428985_10837 [Nocardioides sp. YR527]|uniref:hypothetical protein n=1 Tax=Nocardioides sp. YR527 TaxID=1881028 RepID=UPI00088CD724|nr:hypothetical protein [Nocardioides sp. YR527]SDL00277.1 hypothetical protein SAMN05428985_10837 [Nocardioides sp. YR527]